MFKFRFRITDVKKNRAFMLALYVFGALFTIVAVSAVASFIILRLENPTASISLGAFAALLVSAAISGFGISKLSGGNPKLSAAAHLIAALTILLCSLIFGGGLGGVMNAVCYLGIASLFSLMGKRRRVKHRR